MTLRIRCADLRADRDVLVDTLRRHLNPDYDGDRFDWAYRRNPSGEGRAWIAVEDSGAEIVGMAAVFPRRLFVDGHEEAAWVLGDFCVSERYRSLGPAIQLQRTCLGEARQAVRFCYDFPSNRMMAVYARLGVSSSRRMVRLVRPLKADRYLPGLIKSSVAARLLASAANMMLSLDTLMPHANSDVTVEAHGGTCGSEFTDLAREVSSGSGVYVNRSADYLNWRYLDNPVRRHEVLAARRGQQLRGYLVFSTSHDAAILVDLFAVDGPAVAVELVRALLLLLRARDIATVSAPVIESHPWRLVLEKLQFQPRETSPVVTYDATCAGSVASPPDADVPWFLTYGDVDS